MTVLARERAIVERLEQTGVKGAALFAACCAERLRPLTAHLPAGETALVCAPALAALWLHLSGAPSSIDSSLASLSSACRRAAPPEDEVIVPGVPTAFISDLVASVHYAIETYRTGESKYAVWAARRPLEAADWRAMQRLTDGLLNASAQAALRQDPLIVAETARQDRDLESLLMATKSGREWKLLVEEVWERAKVDGEKFVKELMSSY